MEESGAQALLFQLDPVSCSRSASASASAREGFVLFPAAEHQNTFKYETASTSKAIVGVLFQVN